MASSIPLPPGKHQSSLQRQYVAPSAPLLWTAAFATALGIAMMLIMVGKSPYVAFAGAVGALAGFGCIASTEAGLYALIALASVDGFLKSAVGWPVVIVLKDIALAVILFHWLWDGLNGLPLRSLRTAVATPAFLFTLYCCAQVFNSENMSWMLAIAGLRSWIIWIPIFFIAYDTIRTRQQLDRLLLVIAVVSSATAIYGVIQTQIGFEHLYRISKAFSYYDNFEHAGVVRAPSSYVNPGTAGAAMGFAAIATAGGAIAARFGSPQQVLLAAGAVLSAVGMLAAGSRAPMLGALTAMTLAAVLSRHPRVVIGLALIAALGFTQTHKYVGPEAFSRYTEPGAMAPSTLTARVGSALDKGLRALIKYPLGTGVASGVGVGRGGVFIQGPAYVKPEAAVFVENEIGRVLKELGLPGGVLFFWLLWRLLIDGIRATNRSPGAYRWLGAALIGGAAGVAVQLLVGSALYLAPGGIYFFMACAICQRLPEFAEQEEQAQIPPRPEPVPELGPEPTEAWERMVRARYAAQAARRGYPVGRP